MTENDKNLNKTIDNLTWGPNILFGYRWKNYHLWTKRHSRLSLEDGTPTLSACTTATNLSLLDAGKPGRAMALRDDALPPAEFEPLRVNEKCVEREPFQLDPPAAAAAQRTIHNQVLAAITVSLVSMMVGFTSAYTSPALVSMRADNSTFVLTDNEASWVGSLMPLFAMLGGVLGGPLVEYLGRKGSILVTGALFIGAGLCIGLATSIWSVYVGRAITGLSVGVASLALPVYLGESIQPEVRGTLGLLPTALGNIGVLACFVAGNYLPWHWLALLGTAPALPFFVLALLIPETPRWFVSKGRGERAARALQWLRGSRADISHELDELRAAHQQQQKQASESALADLFTRANMRPLLVSLGLMFFQQLSGINAVIFYTVTIFNEATDALDGNLCTIIVGVVNFASTFAAATLIDRLGRKMLLYVSNCAMVVTLLVLGAYFYLCSLGWDLDHLGWLPLASLVVYVIGFSLGFGPIPWLMMGEILPAKVRGAAASLVTAFNWACTFAVTKTFLDLVRAIGSHGAFWLYGSVCVVGLAFVIVFVPETQGQSLEDIEKKMTGVRVRRMSSRANLKPLPL